MSTPPAISIVIPSYNSAGYIEHTLRSILDQGYPRLECLVMDGGSTDGTVEVLRKYGDRLTWRSEPDRGQSDAINKGLRLAKGDILAYLCADDYYAPGTLNRIASYFEAHPDCEWVYGKCRIVDENGEEIRRLIKAYKDFWCRRYSYNALLVMNFIPQPAVFWRRGLFQETGLFDADSHLAMDYDYWLRVGAKHTPGFIDEYLASFRFHAVSKSSVRYAAETREALRISRRYVKKRPYIVPFQYLNYVLVLLIYSIMKLGQKSV